MSAERTLTFTGVGVDDESIDLTGSGVILTFKPTRNTNKRVSIMNDTTTQAKAFHDAFFIDYAYDTDYKISFSGSEVVITHPNDNHFDGLINNASNISVTSQTLVPSPNISLDSQVYSENGAEKCDKVLMTLNFSEEFGATVQGLLVTRFAGSSLSTLYDNSSHNSNTLALTVDREDYLKTEVIATIGNVDKRFRLSPPKNKLEILDVTQSAEQSGSVTVTIYINSFIGSDETQFAIAETGASPEYVDVNMISGVAPGQYLAYAKDKYGCEKAVSLEVGDINIDVDGEMFVSVKNSHYFADRNIGTNITAGVTNFLSEEDPYQVKAKDFYQVWSSNTITTDQFKSSYPRHEAKVILLCEYDEQGNQIEVDLEVTKRTDNITRDSYLQGKIETDPATNSMRVSFVPGDIYDENGNVIDQHTYDDTLPSFYEGGVYIRISGYEGVIMSIIEENGIDYALTNIPYQGGNSTTTTIHTIHEAFDYDIFEFRLEHLSLLDKEYRIEIKGYSNATTTTFSEYYLSEKNAVISFDKMKESNYHYVKFWSQDNDREIDYTNWDPYEQRLVDDQDIPKNYIVHERFIEFESPLKPISSAEIDADRLDEEFKKLSAETNAIFDTDFTIVPQLYARSLMKLFDESDFIECDGVLFTTSTAAEKEDRGQYAKVRPRLVLAGGSNQTNKVNRSITKFYPVNTA